MEIQTLKFTEAQWKRTRQAVAVALNLLRKRSNDLVAAKFNPASAPDVLLTDLPAAKELIARETKALEELAERMGVI